MLVNQIGRWRNGRRVSHVLGRKRWQGRDLSLKRYVCIWADGVYFSLRLSHERRCILVLMGGGQENLAGQRRESVFHAATVDAS